MQLAASNFAEATEVIPMTLAENAGLDVFEPLVVKEQIVKAASGSVCMILRIDDVIASGKSSAPPMPSGGGMPGAMPPGY